MGHDTQMFERGQNLLEKHKKTAVGGIGGAGIATIVAVVWPYINSMNESRQTQWREISSLKERVIKLEAKVEYMEKAKQ